MAKNRNNEPKKETSRKAIKKPRKAKKKISIPMILTCDGDMASLLPLFVNFSEMLCKRIRKDVRQVTRRRKAATKKKALKTPSFNYEATATTDEAAQLPPVAPVQRGRRAANGRHRKPAPVRQKKRRQWKEKRPHFGPRHKRKSLLPGRYVKPPSESPMGEQRAEIAASETGPGPESGTIVAATPSPVFAAENHRESVAGASNMSMNEAMASFMMLIAAQRSSMDAFSGSEEGQHSAGRYATKHISFNFQDAWNEAMNCQDTDADLLLQPNCVTSVHMTRVYLAAGCPEENTSLNPANVGGTTTTDECSIYNYIRKSLGEICPSISPFASTSNSVQSEQQAPDNAVDIYSHIRNSLGQESARGNGDNGNWIRN